MPPKKRSDSRAPASVVPLSTRAKSIRYGGKKNTVLVRKFKKPAKKTIVSDFIAAPNIGIRLKKKQEARIGLVPDERITRSGLYHWLVFSVDPHRSDRSFEYMVLFNKKLVYRAVFRNTALISTSEVAVKPWLVATPGETNWVTFQGWSGPGGFDLLSLCFHYHMAISVATE